MNISGLEDDYYKAVELFDLLSIEKVFVPGNRDFYNGGNVCFSACFYDLESALDLPEDPSAQRRNGSRPLIIDRDYLLVGICTPRRELGSGTIGHGQKRLTESLFKEQGAEKYKILLMHHHLLPIPIGGLEGNIINDGGDIIRMISDVSIDLVLTGHQHHPWAYVYSSGIHNTTHTTILTCGSPTIVPNRRFTAMKIRFAFHHPVMKPAKLVLISLAILVINSCAGIPVKPEEKTIEGLYIKDSGPPFPGPAILAGAEYFRISSDDARKMPALADRTKIKASGFIYPQQRSFVENGQVREFSEKILSITTFTILK